MARRRFDALLSIEPLAPRPANVSRVVQRGLSIDHPDLARRGHLSNCLFSFGNWMGNAAASKEAGMTTERSIIPALQAFPQARLSLQNGSPQL